jgi:AcrR family transcriptional regulator
MAKQGVTTRVGQPRPNTAGTRAELVEAAITTLQTEGFGGSSARAIARTAGCNQALVFYHFGSVANLLLAALDATSERRMVRYGEAVDAADGLGPMVEVAARIYREDLDAGHMSVLAEMIAGCSSTPGLGAEVSARLKPWIEFAEDATRRGLLGSPLADLLPTRDVAFAVVALYLGIEFLAHLDGDRSSAESLFSTAKQLSVLLGGAFPPAEAAGTGGVPR